ncbi:MAG: hypothetical protein WDM79_09800 [Terricaulis sp.]
MLMLILSYLPALLCGIPCRAHWARDVLALDLGDRGAVGRGDLCARDYFAEMLGGRTARGMGHVAQQALDPERDYRNALKAMEDTESVGNRMRVAQAAAALGRWEDAEVQWEMCLTAHWIDDPTILMGHANALLELERYDEALKRLEQLKALGREGQTPQAALAFGRAYEGLGRFEEADASYRYAADRVPGLEAGGRYVAFMAKAGRKADAEIGLAELDRRLAKIAPPLRPEARIWRDLAARGGGWARLTRRVDIAAQGA